ncbi:class I SAM-dependent methyltransferase [Candidatus Saccharibacteria bacterium]|nr:class I SAM-dependent methyltransferase [Candidatus Saccharibacteria bacterium]
MTKNENNQKTIQVYEDCAQEYIARSEAKKIHLSAPWITRSLAGLPKNAKLFEIGSATGREARLIRSLGYNIQVSDAPSAFVDYLTTIGLDPIQFDLMTDQFPDTYNYILAKATLVHFSHKEVKAALKKVFGALSGGGAIRV